MTWSLESVFHRVVDQHRVALGLLRRLEEITRPLSHDTDAPVDGADRLAEREAEIDAWEPDELFRDCPDCNAITDETGRCLYGEVPQDYPSEYHEPSLSKDELRALRNMIDERYPKFVVESSSASAAGDGGAAVDPFPPDPAAPHPPWSVLADRMVNHLWSPKPKK